MDMVMLSPEELRDLRELTWGPGAQRLQCDGHGLLRWFVTGGRSRDAG